MAKKEKLTAKEKRLMKVVRDEWVSQCDSGAPINKEKAEKWINWLYTSSKLEKPKTILYLSSPLGLQYAYNMLRANVRDNVRDNVEANVEANVWANVWDNVWDNVRDNVWDNVWDNVRANVRDNVRDNVWDNVRANVGANVRANVWANVWANVRDNVGDNVWANVGDNVWANVRDNVGDNVGANVGANVRANVGANVWANVRDNVWDNKKLQWTDFASYGNISDYGWVSFYDFFTRIGVLDHDGFNQFKDGLESNVYDMIQLKEICIVAELPYILKRDEKGRLHSVDSAAIAWRDGYELYYLHGIPFKKEEFENFSTGKITAKDILKEENQDKKRVMAMVYGNERLLNDLQAKALSEEKDDCGYMMRLYSIDLGEDEKLVIYEGVDPAKNEKIYLRVPPEYENKTPLEAKCWTFPEWHEAAQKLGKILPLLEEA